MRLKVTCTYNKTIVRGLNMPTVHPPPLQEPHSLVYFCSLRVSWIRRKKDVIRKNIGMNFMLTPIFIGTPQMTFCVYTLVVDYI